MDVLKSPKFPVEESHRWYADDGEPVRGVPCKSKPGELRAPTVADARKHKFRRSVTTIIRMLDSPGLTRWQIEQNILAALTGPHATVYSEGGYSSDRELLNAVRADADRIRDAAALGGKNIHAVMEAMVRRGTLSGPHGTDVDENYFPHAEAIWHAIALDIGSPDAFTPEALVTHDNPRYGGRADMASVEFDMVIDLKSKETPELVEKSAKQFASHASFPDHKMQVAAYAQALGLTRGAVAFFSRTEPSCRVVAIPSDQMIHYTDCFNALCYFSNLSDRLTDGSRAKQGGRIDA